MTLQKTYRERYHVYDFADDIFLLGENLEKVNNRLDEWRLALEG
jgi:hypothetical protein